MAESEHSENTAPNPSVAVVAREVEEFVAAAGWDQSPQLFALVPTAALLRQQPDLAGQLDAGSPLTPVAQEALPDGDLGDALARIAWPDTVDGCALAQEIIVLPPDAEPDLVEAEVDEDAQRLRRAAADHPRRTEARLVAAVLRDGSRACVMRLRGIGTEGGEDGAEPTPVDEIIENPELAPNLLAALEATLAP
ncbi:PPA1309 family protein [Amycolatopsis aidingensis]|uniref:PPA1309 family protein n=1 Tax=Amycolatopsis aidingensis TaxID=2842453 RepID=UPI001C0C8A0F|nr:PPA1309 family protein [Amycolatopsis aidingensis]